MKRIRAWACAGLGTVGARDSAGSCMITGTSTISQLSDIRQLRGWLSTLLKLPPASTVPGLTASAKTAGRLAPVAFGSQDVARPVKGWRAATQLRG